MMMGSKVDYLKCKLGNTEVMIMQNDLDLFYQDIKNGDQSDLEHVFVKNNNIYFHATYLENLDSILQDGFKPSPKFQCCYFGKSFHICRSYFNSVQHIVFAVDLSDYLNNENEFSEANNFEIRVSKDVRPESIIGYIKF